MEKDLDSLIDLFRTGQGKPVVRDLYFFSQVSGSSWLLKSAENCLLRCFIVMVWVFRCDDLALRVSHINFCDLNVSILV